MPIRQSVCYPGLKPADMTADAFFALLADIGYEAVDLFADSNDFGELVPAAKKHGLVITCIIGHNGITQGLNNRETHEECERQLRKSIDIAADYGILSVVCFSGIRQPGIGEDEAAEITAEGLRRLAPYAERKGVNLILELLNSKVDHNGYQCDHTDWGVAVCELVNSPRVKLLYDIYHMQIMEGDIIRTIRDNIAHIGHFHTAGVPGRHEVDETQELNYSAIARAIDQTGYDSYVGHEFIPEGDAVDALRQAFKIFKQ